ncbi:MAG TPA: M56 family metallopeptidase [Pirellulales bacterium]|jgi:beta-lactamase regulating signal transducer with metallopeptidase domain|nr:M56 family metallopeptidase [Pirellulales bacterium]
MTRLIENLSGPAWQQILLTLAHSLWQGAVLALLLAAVLTRIAGSRPQARYLASLAAVAALVVSCLVTRSVLDLPPSAASPSSALHRPIAAEQRSDPRSTAKDATLVAATDPAPADLGSDHQSAAAAICAGVWLAGVFVMLLRMAWLVTGARRLAARPVLVDRRVLDLVEALRRRLGIRRSIRVIDSASIGPAVSGILRPVLLLPAAIVTELPPDCLEAILAHELAHIRRHDYLVNLVQMLIEAALFFNPAVWWISRQIRREREACCDSLAVGITGQPLTYAQALAAWLERVHADRFSPATAGWLGQGQRGTVLDRVRRLVIAGYRPELRGSWTALATGLVLSAFALAALWTGTRASVALAADILSPRERLEQLVQDRDELRPLTAAGTKATLAGTIRASDGKPLPDSLHGTVLTQNENGGVNGTELFTVPAFSLHVPWGKTWVALSTKGYAPAVLGPLYTKPGQTLDGLDLLLGPGFTSHVRLVDGQDKPIVGATATASLMFDGGNGVGTECDARSDDQGVITLTHLGDASYQFTIAATGFQSVRLGPGKLKPDETITRTLVPAVLTQGVVVSPEGDPIAGAAIRHVSKSVPGSQVHLGMNGPVLATTDGEGRFSLDSLDEDAEYGLVIETPDGGRQFVSNVHSGQSDLRWTAGPPLIVSGDVLGNLDGLRTFHDKPALFYSQIAAGILLATGWAEILPVEGQQQFQLKDVVRLPAGVSGRLVLRFHSNQPDASRAKPTEVTVALDEKHPATDLTIDLDKTPAALPTRRVVLRFVGADPGLAPQGRLSISMTNGTPVADQSSAAEIKDGTVEVDACVPGRIHYAMKNVVGYWFESGVVEVPAGAGPLEHDVPVVAAGGIRGRLLNVEGKPAGGNARVAALAIEKPPGIAINSLGVDDVPVEGSGEFFISPLPLGGRYVVLASRGFENAQSEPVRVDSNKPSPVVKVRFSKTRDVVGHVFDPAGQPLADIPVSVAFHGSPGGMSYLPPQPTDRAGRFEFAGLSTGAGEYLAKIKPRRDFQPAELTLPLEGPPIDIQLKTGHVIAGRLLDAATDEPMAGIPLFAMPSHLERRTPQRYETEEPTTDADGRFRFSVLPEGNYDVIAGCVLAWQSTENERIAHTGESIELRARRPETK